MEKETELLAWINATYNETDFDYIDAVATIFANMSTIAAMHDLDKKILNASSEVAKNLLIEAREEFELEE